MNPLERTLRRLDEAQQRHELPAFLVAVFKKYGDDNGGTLSVQLTYSMFMTVFPLLLLLVTLLTIVLADDPGLRARVLDSAFKEFPIVGQQFGHNIHALKRSSVFGLVVGIVGLVYGCTGLAQSGLFAMAQVWNIPGAERPNFVTRLGRSLTFLLTLGLGLVITTALTGFGGFGGHAWYVVALSVVIAALVNVGLYLAAFRVLTPKQIPLGWLVPGAVFGGVGWTVLQLFGGYLVGHELRGASALYGTFGLVLGLMAWIFLGAQLTLYATELNAVRVRRLWPRALIQPPLTAADQRSIALQAVENRRRPEQEVRTRFRQRPMEQREFRHRGYRLDESRGVEMTDPTDADPEPAPGPSSG